MLLIGCLVAVLASWTSSLLVTFPVSTAVTVAPSKRSAVIAGAGPVGLATALTLAKSSVSKFDDITVVERRQADAFESEKAYLYLLDGRGQRCTDSLDNLTRKFADMAVSSKQFTELTEVLTDGTTNVKKLPVLLNSGVEKYWLPRKVMIDGFLQAIVEHNNLDPNEGAPKIKVMFDTEVSSLTFGNGDEGIQVGLQEGGAQKKIISGAALVVGADGMNSFVRKSMADHCAEGCEDCYIPVQKDSDAAGLTYKILTPKNRFNLPLPEGMTRADLIEEEEVCHSTPSGSVGVDPRFAAMTGLKEHDEGVVLTAQQKKEELSASVVREKEKLQSVPERAYAIRGTGSTDASRLSMGLLPVRDDAPRTCNFVARPGHDIWSIHTPTDLKQYMKKQFPQMSRPLSDFVGDEEIQRFVTARPGVFPKPQYCPSPCGFVEAAAADSDACEITPRLDTLSDGQKSGSRGAIVLLGDSLHAFPPDLGQGVNSGLEDVYELSQALEASDGDLEKALPLFERKRMPEVRALVDLMVFGYPYQYNQGPTWKKNLATLNFGVRLLCSKVMPFLFSPPAFFMIQDPSLPYSTVLRRAHRTTTLLWTGALLALSLIFLKPTAATVVLEGGGLGGSLQVSGALKKVGLFLAWLSSRVFRAGPESSLAL